MYIRQEHSFIKEWIPFVKGDKNDIARVDFSEGVPIHIYVPDQFYFFIFFFSVKKSGFTNCTLQNGGCEQICTDLSEGSFYCSCRVGFKMSSTSPKACDGKLKYNVRNNFSLPMDYS